MFFILRQVYRVFVIVPFHFFLFLVFKLENVNKVSEQSSDPYSFIITSIIYPKKNKKIQYDAPRSIFSPEDRARQTLETISSIRNRVPKAKIILVEGGLQESLPFGLDKKVDQYIYVGKKKLVRWSCDSKQKSLGEIIMLYFAMKEFKFIADFYFKISGRYYLNDEFDLNNWKKGNFILQYIKSDYMCTRLYGFKRGAFLTWKYALIKGIPLALIAYPIENTLLKHLPKKQIYKLGRLGLSGVGASSSEKIRD